MGAADFNTSAKIKGTKEEVLSILKVLLNYNTTKKEQYNKKRNCPYLTSVYIHGSKEKGMGTRLAPAEDADLLKFIEENNCEIVADASGPYGSFGLLEEVDIFHDMAEAAPTASFSGGMGGFGTGGDQFANFELKDGLLYCKYSLPSDDELNEDEYEDDESYDDDDDWEDEEPIWDEEVVYDPIKKKNVKK